MRCRDVVGKRLVVCRDTDTVLMCARLMKDRRIGFLPVLGPDDRLKGVLTDRDLTVRILAEDRPSLTLAGSVMTRTLLTCHLDDELSEAEKKMAHSRKSRIPIVDDGGFCVGVISLSDVAQKESRRRTGGVLKELTRRESPLRPRSRWTVI